MRPSNINEERSVVTVNIERDMAVYDLLPDVIRDELKCASTNRSATELGVALASRAPVADVLRLVRAEERSAQAEYRRRVGL